MLDDATSLFITAKERSEGASIYRNNTNKTVPSTEVSVSSAGQMCQELEARSILCQLVLGRFETVSRTVCGSVNTVTVKLLCCHFLSSKLNMLLHITST